jgi:hypothetical protein
VAFDSGAFFLGFPFFVAVVNLPLRLQIVNGETPIGAGLRVMPFLSFNAVGEPPPEP